MDFCQPVGGAMPSLTTKETQRLRQNYPNIEFLEAGHAASWLQERHDQLLVKAQKSRSQMNVAKLITLSGAVSGLFFYATSPFAIIGAIASCVGYAWSVGMDWNDSHRFAPLPFIRDNFIEFMQAMGDAEAREEWFSQGNEIADLMFHLDLLERYEFAILREFSATLSEYLDQVEAGKRFYAYRWLCDRYVDYKGAIPNKESLDRHLESVTPDPRINYNSVQAIQQVQVIQQQRPKIIELPQSQSVALPEPRTVDTRLTTTTAPIAPEPKTVNIPSKPQQPQPEIATKLSLRQRADYIAKALISSGFKVDEVLSSQVVAIASSQRGGKGTLAAILAILSKAYDSNLIVEYFTAGVDVYPFACNLHSALDYPGKSSDQADKAVAEDLLRFLKYLENSEPYSHKNLVLVVDETMRLLSLVGESDRTWALQFLLSRLAKTGVTLIIVLHATNLSSIAGKETAGLASTFKEGVQFVGCSSVSVPIDEFGLRKIDIASGEYFKADPRNFGKSLKNGELGSIPDWLKTEKHPGNGYPDPARTMLKFFPELVVNIHQKQDALLQSERGELRQAIEKIKYTVFSTDGESTSKLIQDLKQKGREPHEIISMLWQVTPNTPQWEEASAEYEFLEGENE